MIDKDPIERHGFPGVRAASATIVIVGLVACGNNAVGPEPGPRYQIVEGACGDVSFVESLGPDSASAVSALDSRKAQQFGAGQVSLALHRVEVSGRSATPDARFYAVRVEASETGLLVHSVAEVITTEGDLFNLSWCPD